MISRFSIIIMLFLLVACSATVAPKHQVSTPEKKLLTEADFKQAVRRYLENGGGPVVSTYEVVLADLNGDNKQEGLVMMNTPFNTWCHLAGCTLLIFEEQGNNISLNSRVEPIRGPLFIHDTGDKWKSIVSRQYGINRDARYIQLENTGYGYPAFTLNAPNYNGASPQSGFSYFY